MIELRPTTDKDDSMASPLILPKIVTMERLTPNLRLWLATNNIAGPGIAAATKAIMLNVSQLSKLNYFLPLFFL